jgi:hypothetical protein
MKHHKSFFPTLDLLYKNRSPATIVPVPIQNLNPDVLMMEPPLDDWYRCDVADLLRPPKIRSIFIQ